MSKSKKPAKLRLPVACKKCGALAYKHMEHNLADGIASWDIEVVTYNCGRTLFDWGDGERVDEWPGVCSQGSR